MRKWIVAGTTAAVMFACSALFAHAQVQVQPNPRVSPNVAPPPQIISGADFGFRVDSISADGTVSGRIVVRQNGQWVEVRLTGGVRKLDVR